MTEDDFRKLALSHPGAEERSHMLHPDFRVRGRIFATLPGLDEDLGALGMVELTPRQQSEFVGAAPAVFRPCQGAWGIGGATYVRLGKASKRQVQRAVRLAWTNIAEAETASRRGAGGAGKARKKAPRARRRRPK